MPSSVCRSMCNTIRPRITSRPRSKGFQLMGDNYEVMPLTALPDGTMVLHSTVLGLDPQT